MKARALTVEVRGGRPRERRQQAGAREHRRAAVVAQPRGGRRLLDPGAPAVHADGGLRGVGRRGAADGGDVVEQGAVGVVADRGDHRHAEQGDRAAERLVAEAQQVGERAAAAGHDHHLDLPHGREIRERANDRRRGVAVLHGGEAPHQPPRPAAAGERGEDVVAGLAVSRPVITPIVRGSSGRARRFWGSSRPSRVELLAQAVDPGQQVSLAGDAQVGDREGEGG